MPSSRIDATAQQGTAEIRGRVVDQSGAALPGATVVVRNQASGVYRQGVSTGDGTYFLTGVTPGVYELTAEMSGFKKYARKDIRLEVGKTATVDVQLEVGGLTEELTVSAEAPIVDVTSKEVGGNITNQDLISLPSVNRNFIGFIGLLPGVVPSISTESFGSDSVTVNGQDARNNNYLLDGGNNNDDVIGQRAGTQARTPIESIQEFQVLTSQYDAEFGRTHGRDHQRGHQAGRERTSTAPPSTSCRTPPTPRRTTSSRRTTSTSPTRASSSSGGPSAAR